MNELQIVDKMMFGESSEEETTSSLQSLKKHINIMLETLNETI